MEIGVAGKVGDSDDLTPVIQIPGDVSASHARGAAEGAEVDGFPVLPHDRVDADKIDQRGLKGAASAG